MPHRPRRPTGFVRRHPDTQSVRWQAVVKYPDPDTGRWRQRAATFARKTEAQAWLTTALAEHTADPAYRPPSEETLAAYLARWLDEVAAGRVRGATTLASYRQMARHLVDRLGAKPLAALTPLDFQGLYTALAQAGKAANTIRRVHALAHRALADAVDFGLLPRNPADRAKPPRAGRPALTVPTVEQAQALLRVVEGDRLRALWWFLALTGCRRGEALGLRWTDIDWAAKTVAIQRALVGKGRHRTLHEPKTARGRRTLALSDVLASALREHRQAQRRERLAAGPAWEDSGFVFTTRHGRWLGPDWVWRRFKALVRQAGLPDTIRVHDLRHAMATYWLAEGVPVPVVAERLGHASPAITLQLYGHVLPNQQADAAARLDAALAAGVTTASPRAPKKPGPRPRRRD